MRSEPVLAAKHGHALRWGGAAVLAAALVLCLGSGARADVLYVDIGAGDAHTCAVRADGDIACWGDNSAGQANPPTGKFSAVTVGGRHTCAQRNDTNTVACWGDNSAGQANPPGDKFFPFSVSAGLRHTCGVKLADFTVACWGDNTSGQASPPPPGKFAAGFSTGRNHTCGIREDSVIVCWGDNTFGQATPPQGPMRPLFITAGGRHTCIVRADQGSSAVCWGDNSSGQATPTAPGPFDKISAGEAHTCALARGRVFCWGSNTSGQATPPGDPPPLVNIVTSGCSPCRVGDSISLSLDFSNPVTEPRTVELTFVGHFPDGVTVRSFLAPDLKVSLPPGESALRLDPATLTPDLPAGTYFLEAALLHPATGVTLSRHSVPLQLVPLSAGP
jgi:Regulator of chromosome condensation (RCC1) repeat